MSTPQAGKTLGMRLRVLAVDDQVIWRDLIRHRLERDGRFEVETVATIEEGRQRLACADFHIVILDINLNDQSAHPNKDGMLLLAELHERQWIGKAMMVVMLSGNEVIANITD